MGGERIVIAGGSLFRVPRGAGQRLRPRVGAGTVVRLRLGMAGGERVGGGKGLGLWDEVDVSRGGLCGIGGRGKGGKLERRLEDGLA